MLETLELTRPTEQLHSVADFSDEMIASHVQDGRDTWIFDLDGTLTTYLGWDVSPEIVERFARFRELGVKNIAIETHSPTKTDADLLRLEWIARLLNVDFVMTPRAGDERKPSRYMDSSILQHFDRQPNQALKIGDKRTSDVMSANFGDIYSMLVDNIGGDHPGDAIVTRPYEKSLEFMLKLKFAKELQPYPVNPDAKREKLPRREIKASPEVARLLGKVAYVGEGPQIELIQETFDKFPLPKTEPVHAVIRAAKNKFENSTLYDHLKDNGKRYANRLTKARMISIFPAFVAIVAKWPQLAQDIVVLSYITDFIDGPCARIYNKFHPVRTETVNAELTTENAANSLDLLIRPNVEAAESRLNELKEQAKKDKQKPKIVEYLSNEFFKEASNNSGKKSIGSRFAALKTSISKIKSKAGWRPEYGIAQNSYNIIKNNFDSDKDPNWGEKWDPKADKYLGYAVGAGLSIINPWLLIPTAVIIGRDVYRDQRQRPRLEKEGFDGKDLRATRSSKNSTAILSFAEVYCLTNPRLAYSLTALGIAGGAKLYSLKYSRPIWEQRRTHRLMARIAQEQFSLAA